MCVYSALKEGNVTSQIRHLARTSVLTEKYVVADGAWFGKSVELVEPFSGDVELQQAGLLHVRQSHHLLPLSH